MIAVLIQNCRARKSRSRSRWGAGNARIQISLRCGFRGQVALDRAKSRRAAMDDANRDLLAELRGYGGEAHLFNVNAASATGRAEVLAALRDLPGGRGAHVVLHSAPSRGSPMAPARITVDVGPSLSV
jgi:hypothetical protein